MKRTTGRRILTLPEIQGISLVCDKHRGYPPCVFCMQQAFASGQDSMETKEDPQVKTRERRVEGFVANGISEYSPVVHVFTSPEDGRDCPATLIIHEPIPEPTLVEAVEEFLHGSAEFPAGNDKGRLKAALLREESKSTR